MALVFLFLAHIVNASCFEILNHSRMPFASYIDHDAFLIELKGAPVTSHPNYIGAYVYGVSNAPDAILHIDGGNQPHVRTAFPNGGRYHEILENYPGLNRPPIVNLYFQFDSNDLVRKGLQLSLEVTDPLSASTNPSSSLWRDPESLIPRAHREALTKTFLGYEGNIDRTIIELVYKVETLIEKEKETLLSVYSPERGIIGTLRWFEGNPLQVGKDLPLSVALALRNQYPQKLQSHILSFSRHRIVELGKFLLLAEGTLRSKSRDILERYVRRELLLPEGIVFYTHVASEKHKRLYELEWGFRELERFDFDDGHFESILFITGNQLAAKLDKKIKKNLGLYYDSNSKQN